MTKREVIKTYLAKHRIHLEADCDMDEEADENFIKACEKIRDWVLNIDEEKKNESIIDDRYA